MSELSKFKKELGKWSSETFDRKLDPIVSFSLLIHLKKEIQELEESIRRYDKDNIREESADCFMLLLDIANCYDFDILEAARDKLKKNKNRTWGKPDKDGVIEHRKG